MDWESFIPVPPSEQLAEGLRVGCMQRGLFAALYAALETSDAAPEHAPDPQTLADTLGEDKVHGAMLPLPLYPELDGLSIVPGIALATPTAPTTERLMLRAGADIPSVIGYDPRYGRYDALCRLLLKDEAPNCRFVETPWEERESAEAYLYTEGMPLTLDDPDFASHRDLGAEWIAQTGLPWVYGVWVIGRSAARAPLRGALAIAHRTAEAHVDTAIAHAIDDKDPHLAHRLKAARWTTGADEADAIRAFFEKTAPLGPWKTTPDVRFC